MTTNLQEELESAIDRQTLAKVIATLAEVCNLKAEHILGDWQDINLAGNWMAASVALDRVAAKAKEYGL